MQRFTSIILLRVLACAVSLAPAVHAAELGDVAVRSFIGQPLAADIELVALAPDELNALQVKLAQADVFRGANITMNPALSSVRMAVVKRDQKQFLHVTTTRPITTEYVHLYLELSAAGRHDVRLATVWLQTDPNPAPPPAAPLAGATGSAVGVGVAAGGIVAGGGGAAGAADPAQLAAQARAERVSAAAAIAGGAAVTALPSARDRSRPAPLPSVHETEFGVPGAIRAAAAARAPSTAAVAMPASARPGAPLAVRELPSRIADAMGTPRITHASGLAAAAPDSKPDAKLDSKPDAKLDAKPENKLDAKSAKMSASTVAAASPATPAKPASKREAAADAEVPAPASPALLKLPALPLPAGVKRAATPAACAPTGMSAKECKALDTQSAALSSKLVELEAKMKALQGAINGAAPVAQKTGQAARAVAAGTAALAAAGSSVAAAVASPAMAATDSAPAAHDAPKQGAPTHDAPKSASVASAAPGPGAGPALASAKVAAPQVAASDDAHGTADAEKAHAAKDGPSASATASADLASASASAGEQGASATATASGAAAPAKPLKRVLPKLKYKKEKPVDQPTNYVAWGAGGLAALVAAGAGMIYWRRKKSGAAPLKIWQGFRKKKPAEPVAAAPEAPAVHEAKAESIAQ